MTPGAVSQWLRWARKGGIEGLRRRKAPGAARRLTPEQLAQIPPLLERGAESFGFKGTIWTCRRIAQVIRHTFGISYHRSQVSRLLRVVAGVHRDRCAGPPNETRQPSSAGSKRAGARSKKGHRRKAYLGVRRRIGVLPVADGSSYLCPSGKNPHYSRVFDPGPSFGD